MPIPGANIYNQATQIISKSTYTYYAFLGRVIDDRGIQVSNYAPGVALADSIQAVSRSLYEDLGLDWQKVYINIFTNNALMVLDRDVSGDQIEFNTARYELLSSTDWNPQDGWRQVLAVRLADEISP